MARILSSIVGHEKTIDVIWNAKSVGQLPSAMIFFGQEGIGKQKVAFALAQALVCEKDSNGCGQCGPCLRIEEKHSESLLFIESEKSTIKIEKTREILEFLSLRSIGKARIIIINDAHGLNPQASNVLLKVLEEPPEGTHFIFVTHKPNQLIATIRSRSQMFGFQSLNAVELKKISVAPDWVYRASGGSPLKMLELLDPEMQSHRQQAAEIFENLLTDRAYFYQNQWREIMKDRETTREIFRIWLGFIRDASMHHLIPHSTINVDRPEILSALEALKPETLNKMIEYVTELEPALSANRDPLLVTEDFIIKTLHLN